MLLRGSLHGNVTLKGTLQIMTCNVSLPPQAAASRGITELSERHERVVSGFTHSSGVWERCTADQEDLLRVLGAHLDALTISHDARARQAAERALVSPAQVLPPKPAPAPASNQRQHQQEVLELQKRVSELEQALVEERLSSNAIKQASAREAAEQLACLESLRASSSERLQSERQRLGSRLEGLTAEVTN